MNVATYFDSRKKESKELVDLLTAHMATWPENKKEFDRIDQECVKLAGKLNAERLAGSPGEYRTESDLILLRRQRDNIKHVFQIRRDELHRQIEVYTRPVITDACESLLESMRKLTGLYSFERLEPARNFEGRKVRPMVKVRHNGAALDRCRDRILQLRREISEMRHCSLEEIGTAIAAAEKEIRLFPLNTMEIVEVSETTARDMAPSRETDNLSRAIKMPDGKLRTLPETGTGPRIQALSDRLTKLEQGA